MALKELRARDVVARAVCPGAYLLNRLGDPPGVAVVFGAEVDQSVEVDGCCPRILPVMSVLRSAV